MKKLLVVAFGLTAASALAQTNSVPVIPGVPVDSLGWINLLIVGATPIIIAGIKKVVPKIPSLALPFLAPLVGVALTQLESLATGNPTNLIIGAVTGAVGLWLREAVDQSKQKLTEAAPTP